MLPSVYKTNTKQGGVCSLAFSRVISRDYYCVLAHCTRRLVLFRQGMLQIRCNLKPGALGVNGEELSPGTAEHGIGALRVTTASPAIA